MTPTVDIIKVKDNKVIKNSSGKAKVIVKNMLNLLLLYPKLKSKSTRSSENLISNTIFIKNNKVDNRVSDCNSFQYNHIFYLLLKTTGLSNSTPRVFEANNNQVVSSVICELKLILSSEIGSIKNQYKAFGYF